MIWQSPQRDFEVVPGLFHSGVRVGGATEHASPSLQDELPKEESDKDGCYDNEEGGQGGRAGFSAKEAGRVCRHVV